MNPTPVVPMTDPTDDRRPVRPRSTEDYLPLVYDELRRIASARMANLPPGNTLQPTALVHEAYLRLSSGDPAWNSRAHFVCAAVESMRQVLVDQVRRKKSVKRGGDRVRVELVAAEVPVLPPTVDLLDFHDTLSKLERHDERKARIVLLRCFGGLERREVADALEVSVRTIDREWRFIVAWFHRELAEDSPDGR
jgi:RNA polymerase sigma factor (TIGR02999 family)